jgi:hypothetical protein
MTHRRAVVRLVVLAVVLAGGLLAARRASPARVYTVAEVQAGLAHHLKAWMGRVVLVRGVFVTADEWQSPTLIAEFCDSNSTWCPLIAPDGHAVHLALNGTTRQTRGAVLWQTPSPPGFLLLRAQVVPNRLLAFLHTAPGLGHIVPLPSALVRGKVSHIMRIRLLPSHTSCQGGFVGGGWPCDDALLLDVLS